MNQENKYIVIEGNIGAGKTSLSTRIANDFNARLVLEQFAENPFLPKFYKNPERYAFPLEMSFLATRYKQLLKELSNQDLFQPVTIADYYFIKSLIFAKGTLDNEEFSLYRQMFNITYTQLPKPNLYVYLHQSVDKLLAQITNRGRDYELNIKSEYLKTIQDNYFDFFKSVNDYPILIIDCINIDFINNPKDYEQIRGLITNTTYANGVHRVKP